MDRQTNTPQPRRTICVFLGLLTILLVAIVCIDLALEHQSTALRERIAKQSKMIENQKPVLLNRSNNLEALKNNVVMEQAIAMGFSFPQPGQICQMDSRLLRSRGRSPNGGKRQALAVANITAKRNRRP